MADRSGSPAPRAAVCVLGAPDDTGNLGVTALLHATLAGLRERLPGAAVLVFDNGWGVRTGEARLGEDVVRYQRYGLRLSRRVHRRESLANVRVSSLLGGLGNPAARALGTATAVLDVSGGDSFSDIYGPRRYRMVTVPKRVVLARRRPLLLLPQTYGPFASPRRRRQAIAILRRATMAWARDEHSHMHLRRLLGDAYDPERHRSGVDVAFGLPVTEPAATLDVRLRGWLAADRAAPVAGINVSGLLANDAGAPGRFGLSLDYTGLLRALVDRLLGTGARVVLVPHVLGRGAESDSAAVEHLLAGVAPEHGGQVAVAPATSSPGEVKWLVGRFDWFCGTRMHSTIAALSSGVPASAVAYSRKTEGVFATCGLGDQVVDARAATDRDGLDRLLDGWRRRAASRERLAGRLPTVLARAGAQMDTIAGEVTSLASAEPRRRRRAAPAGWSM